MGAQSPSQFGRKRLRTLAGCDSCSRNASPVSSAQARRRILTNQPRNNLPRRDAGRRQLNVLCLIAEVVAWRSSCFDPGPFGVATFLPLEQLLGAKMSQQTLKSLNFVGPGHAEFPGSSPVAPARKINDLAEPGSDCLQNPDRRRYKNSRLSFLFLAAADLTGRIADPYGSHVDGGVGFMQSIGNGKCVGHRVLQSRKGRGKALS
jgi:hypothetical protein